MPAFPNTIEVRFARKEELVIVSEMERKAFHGRSLSAERLIEWWKAYSKGVHLLIVDGAIAGAMGIWPLREPVFLDLTSGGIEEASIRSEEIVTLSETGNNPQAFWYFASIIVREDCRGQGVSKTFSTRAIANWIQSANLADNLDLCALAFSKMGENWLRKNGFENTEGGNPLVFRRKVGLNEIKLENQVRAVANEVPAVPAFHIGAFMDNHDSLSHKWDAINGVTALVELLAAAGVKLFATDTSVTDNQIRAWISAPTSKQWLQIAKKILQGDKNHSVVLNDIWDLAKTVLDDRNEWAHFVSITSRLAPDLLCAQESDIKEGFAKLSWLKDCSLVVRDGDVLRDLRGWEFDRGKIFSSSSEAILFKTKKIFEERQESVVLVWGEDCLSLWPLFRYVACNDPQACQPEKKSAYCTNEVRLLQIYMRMSSKSENPDYAPIGGSCYKCRGSYREQKALEQMFSLGKQPEVPNFDEEIYGDANEHVGRFREIATVQETLTHKDSCGRIFWIWGGPGIGKSYLVARVAADLLESSDTHSLILFYRFREGDSRNNREDFLRLLQVRLKAFLQPLTTEAFDKSANGYQTDISISDEVRNLLSYVPADYRVILILDGLDEILRFDPDFISQVPLALIFPRATWLITSQEISALKKYLDQGIFNAIFKNGLPPMSDEDIRFMLFGSLSSRGSHSDWFEAAQKLIGMDKFDDTELKFKLPLNYAKYFIKRTPTTELIKAFDEQKCPLSKWTKILPISNNTWVVFDSCGDEQGGRAFKACARSSEIYINLIKVENDFTKAVETRAEGLPLYVKYLISEVREAGSKYRFNSESLPKGLMNYHKKLFRKAVGSGDRLTLKSLLASTISVAKEPLTANQLGEILSGHGLLNGYDGLEPEKEVESLLANSQILFTLKPTREQAYGYAPYHNSLREYLERKRKKDLETANAMLSFLCKNLRDTPQSLKLYTIRQGIWHQVRNGSFADAINLWWEIANHKIKAISDDMLQHFAKIICMHLAPFLDEKEHSEIAAKDTRKVRKFELEAYAINPERLTELMMSFYEVDPLYHGFKLIRKYHKKHWKPILRIVLRQDDMIARYTAGKAIADDYLTFKTYDVMREIRKMMRSRNLDSCEVGNYAIKFVYMGLPRTDLESSNVRKVLAELAVGKTVYHRGALGELLIHLTYRDGSAKGLVDENLRSFWNPIWDYNKVEIEEIKAAEAFRNKVVPKNMRIRELLEFIKNADNLRRNLIEDKNLRGKIKETLENYFELQSEMVRRCELDLRRCSTKSQRDCVYVLMAHPSWDIREAAATVLATVAANNKEAVTTIVEFFREPEPGWKIRYGAVEAAWSYRTVDHGQLFCNALEMLSDDKNCRVRGLLSENLAEWFKRERQFLEGSIEEKAIRRFLIDTDSWPLENMYLLCNEFYKDQRGFFENRNGKRRFDSYKLSPLIKNAKRLSGDASAPWYSWSREEFLLAIEEVKKIELCHN